MDLGLSIINVASPLLMSDKKAKETSEKQKLQVRILDFHYSLKMQFLYKKKWDKRHKISIRLTKDIREALTLEVNLLLALLTLCTEANQHPLKKKFNVNYEDGIEWFTRIQLEEKNLELEMIFSNSYPPQYDIKKGRKKGKQASVDRNRDILKLIDNKVECDDSGQGFNLNSPEFRYLKKYKEEYLKSEVINKQPINVISPEKQPHLKKLIDLAIEAAQTSEYWKSQYFTPYMRAYRELLRDIERNPVWQQVYAVEDKLLSSSGSGKHYQNLLSGVLTQ